MVMQHFFIASLPQVIGVWTRPSVGVTPESGHGGEILLTSPTIKQAVGHRGVTDGADVHGISSFSLGLILAWWCGEKQMFFVTIHPYGVAAGPLFMNPSSCIRVDRIGQGELSLERE